MKLNSAAGTEKISVSISSKNGGKRPGAGRKKGAPNKKTAQLQREVAESGITPLDFMLDVMRKEPGDDLESKDYLAACVLRFEAAKAAAPYIHPKLASIEHSGPAGGPIDHNLTVEFVGVRPL